MAFVCDLCGKVCSASRVLNVHRYTAVRKKNQARNLRHLQSSSVSSAHSVGTIEKRMLQHEGHMQSFVIFHLAPDEHALEHSFGFCPIVSRETMNYPSLSYFRLLWKTFMLPLEELVRDQLGCFS